MPEVLTVILPCPLKDLESRFASGVETGEKSSAVVAVEVLLAYLQHIAPNVNTLSEVIDLIKSAISHLKSTVNSADPCLESGCQIFLHHVTRLGTSLSYENQSLIQIMQQLQSLGKQYLSAITQSKQVIAKNATSLIRSNSRILVHGRSRVVLEALKLAHKQTPKRFSVLVTESQPDRTGAVMHNELLSAGIRSELIRDAAVGFHMERVDCVCVGAESVCQSGGVINKIGTLSIALCAKQYNTPVYVFAESYKFTQKFPLSNSDIPSEWQVRREANPSTGRSLSVDAGQILSGGGDQPWVDYTEPNLITFVVSDLGILTPSTVCEQLLRLYE